MSPALKNLSAGEKWMGDRYKMLVSGTIILCTALLKYVSNRKTMLIIQEYQKLTGI